MISHAKSRNAQTKRAVPMSVISNSQAKLCSAARDCYNLSTCAMLTTTTATTMQPDRMCELWGVLLKYICLAMHSRETFTTQQQQLAAAPYDFRLFHHLAWRAHRWWHTGTQIVYFIWKSVAGFWHRHPSRLFSFLSSSSGRLDARRPHSVSFSQFIHLSLCTIDSHVQSIQQIISLQLLVARVDVV